MGIYIRWHHGTKYLTDLKWFPKFNCILENTLENTRITCQSMSCLFCQCAEFYNAVPQGGKNAMTSAITTEK